MKEFGIKIVIWVAGIILGFAATVHHCRSEVLHEPVHAGSP